ncbi:MAG: hypothetical protein ACRDQ5_13220 [Sciscionella sp.]
MIPDSGELDAVVAELPRAGFVPGVAAWLGGTDTVYSRVRGGRITVLVLAAYGPWIVLTGPAAHSPHWSYTHAPVHRRDLPPHEAIRVALATDTTMPPGSEGWPQENPNDE